MICGLCKKKRKKKKDFYVSAMSKILHILGFGFVNEKHLKFIGKFVANTYEFLQFHSYGFHTICLRLNDD